MYLKQFSRKLAGFVVPVVAIGSSSIATLPSYAQTVSVAPMVNTLKLKNGQAKASIVVTNTSNEPFRARVFLENFKMDNTGYVALPKDAPNSALPYVQYSPRELDLAPGVSRTIRVTISLPPSVTDGEYRTALVTEDLKERKIVAQDGNTTVIKLRLAAALLVQKGNVSPQLSVIGGNWNRDKNYPILQYRNSGTASTIAAIDWTLKQGGKTVKTGRAEAITMLGNSEKGATIPIPSNQSKQQLDGGAYQLEGKIVYENKSVPFNVKIDVPITTK
jgi:P pilus assembly chaperone PapD